MSLFTRYGRSRVRVAFCPTWFFGWQTVRVALPIGNGGLVISICLIPGLAIHITI